MKTEKYFLSPYHYEESLQMQVAQNKKPKAVHIQGNEAAIIRTLAKYRILNKRGIVAAVNRLLPAQRRKPSYDKEIGILFDGGYIKKYSYKDMDNGRSNVVAFTLTDKGNAYIADNQIRISYIPITDKQRYDTSSVLEHLTLNLWHLRLLEKYEPYIQNESYQLITRIQEDKSTIIPSCIMLENKEWSLLKRFTVTALPFIKVSNEITKGAFLNSIMAINSFLNQNKRTHKLSFIIVLVDSFKQMEEAGNLIASYLPLGKMQIYYAIDEFVNDEQPLKWIYEINVSEDKKSVRYDLIDLTQKEVIKEGDTK